MILAGLEEILEKVLSPQPMLPLLKRSTLKKPAKKFMQLSALFLRLQIIYGKVRMMRKPPIMPRSQQIMLRSMKRFAESKINLVEGVKGSFIAEVPGKREAFKFSAKTGTIDRRL